MQTGQNTLQIRSDSYYDPKQGRLGADSAFLAIDPNTGRILWRKSSRQLNCPAGYSWLVDIYK